MEAKKKKLASLIDSKMTWIIPVYQRNYDWKQDNCKQIFEDIKTIVQKENLHFFGTFVCQEIDNGEYKKRIIIDGQQRLTSIMLFMKAIFDYIDDEELRDRVKRNFLKNERAPVEYNFKLQPLEYDRDIFKKLIDCDEFDEKIFSEEDKASNIYKNYNFFKEQLKSIVKIEEIKKFYNAIYKLEIVEILLDNENPQQIFESLNSTGLDLSNTDLIRNYLLMQLSPDIQEIFYKNYWNKIEKMIKSENMETFIFQYLIAKRRSNDVMQNGKKTKITNKNLYYSFKKYFKKDYSDFSPETVELFFEDLYLYAGFYKNFLFNDNTNYSILSDLDKKFYELIYILEAKNSPIILMYLYNKYNSGDFSQQTFIKFLDILISLTFRSKVCRFNVITPQFAGNFIARLNNLNDESLDVFWNAITFSKDKSAFPNDEQFKTSLINESLYTTIKSDGCKYLLYSLELNLNEKKYLPPYAITSVDHIMPIKLNATWKKYLQFKNDLQFRDQFLHTIGNLALTDAEKFSTDEFKEKKVIYAQSNYHYTKDLINNTDWTSKQIQFRSKKLAELALRIWILPEKYNKILPTINMFDFDADAGIFKGRKPEKLSISGNEIDIKNWSNFLVEIVKQFYNLDKDNFKCAVSMDNVPSRVNLILMNLNEDDKLKRPFEIDKNYYICTNFGADVIFKIARAIVENFDAINNTNFKNEIWFTLKK